MPLDMPGSRELNESRRQLITQLESRLLPHLEHRDVPTVLVFGGSSGAGKSTLVNSLLGEEVSSAGVLRPTTRTPVIAIHPDDEAVMRQHSLTQLGDLVVRESAVPGVAIVDAPDLDSVDNSNRELSARLLDSADLWVFVTTSARYGDALAWSTLERANDRGMTVAVVLDRVPKRALTQVRADLVERMGQLGLSESPLFIIPDVGPHEGLLPKETVAELRNWIEVIGKTRVGESLVDRTTTATLPQLRADLLILADAVESQAHAIVDLKDKAVEGVQAPFEKLATNIENGRFGQGAPTTSWLSLASSGGPLASLVAGRKPNIITSRSTTPRDNAMTAIFDSVLTSAKVALSQGIAAAQANVREAWTNDVVETDDFLAQAEANIDADSIIETALSRWTRELKESTAGLKSNPWLSNVGNAALIGSAAGGVSGAKKAATFLNFGRRVDDARASLVAAVREAMDTVSGAYISVLDDVTAGDSQTLRLRASEFLDRS